ncbi:hypothetical protein Ciccas_004089 [Cichlidogyrus casuarinus]|uniref:Uncharacterized protein n=1 Tax=Cichlidogyrus casuarinus TaxID=1844966 RepID=A0ABD2QCM9_9PLAT
MSHPEGSFPIHFLASPEYQWICRSRVYPYEVGLKYKGNTAPGTSRFEKAFNKGEFLYTKCNLFGSKGCGA